MKAILSYGNYLNLGKNYQIKFIYEEEYETKIIKSLIASFGKENQILPKYGKFSKRRNTLPIDVIDKTNIPKEMLLPFINLLTNQLIVKVVIGNQEFNSFELKKIEEAIEQLHINVTLTKGVYFGKDNTYYVTFHYASEEQKEEISYDFNCRLVSILGETYEHNIKPNTIRSNGKRRLSTNDTINATNIPEQLLPYFIKRFIEEYDMIVTIGSEKFKDNFDKDNFQKALLALEEEKTSINKGRCRTRKIQGIRYY